MMTNGFWIGSREADYGKLSSVEKVCLDPREFRTHGLILGQTGSGKTGLGISLLEEAAIAGIPVIAIDPKGDLGNLLLQFPDFDPDSFAPWSDSPDDDASSWSNGVAGGTDRMRSVAGNSALRIYTPGSTRGRPLSLVRSISPPDDIADSDAWTSKLQGETSALLELAGVSCDANSPESLLISATIEAEWAMGNEVEIPRLIKLVQRPKIQEIGALPVSQACPKSKRVDLARKLNSLLASPSMQAWSSGPDLDIGSLLRANDGRPSISIISIAHLDDSQRMFLVTKLLNELVAWMRKQPGTSDLRALLYIDEVFGYLPPVKAPPSKGPMLTLLKQARAFGLGVVLSSQNPADVDYRALSNLGTWMLGKLQTERDIEKVAAALRSAAAEQGQDLDMSTLKEILSGMPKRTFLLRSPGTQGLKKFETRWTYSFLRGPMTVDEIRLVTEGQDVARLEAAVGFSGAAVSIPPDASSELVELEPIPYFLKIGEFDPRGEPHYVDCEAEAREQDEKLDWYRQLLPHHAGLLDAEIRRDLLDRADRLSRPLREAGLTDLATEVFRRVTKGIQDPDRVMPLTAQLIEEHEAEEARKRKPRHELSVSEGRMRALGVGTGPSLASGLSLAVVLGLGIHVIWMLGVI